MEKARILFIDMHHSCCSRLAQVYAQKYIGGESRVMSAGIVPKPLSSIEQSLLSQSPIENIPEGICSWSDMQFEFFDLIVTIGRDVCDAYHAFMGYPAVIHWDMELPSFGQLSESDCEKAFSSFKRHIDDAVKALFSSGSVPALVRQHSFMDILLGSLQEGIIAHDLNRRIFLFSRGAETLSGISQQEILGRDCHEVFKPRFCGEECAFCDRGDYDSMPHASYTSVFLAPDGSRKELEVTRTPLRNGNGLVFGVVAVISDTTRIRELEAKLGEAEQFSGIIGQDPVMVSLFQLVMDLAESDFSVIISGESGTGKELVANAIHKESSRRDRLFVPVNCGALPEGTLESELFGHVKGAFTGAIRDKKGRFELADKGTLFLDEVAELSPKMQVKLLRVLQEGVFEPVGSETPKKVNVRIICATNKDLKDMVAKGTFRDDLYYRLAVVPIVVPPLRKRRTDIPLLAKHFLAHTTRKLSREEMSFSYDAMSLLMSYDWPGNVRQLQNAIQFALIKCRNTVIKPDHLPPEIPRTITTSFSAPKTPGKVGRKPKLTKEMVEHALTKTGGNKAKAARLLGVGRATLYNFINDNRDELVSVEV